MELEGTASQHDQRAAPSPNMVRRLVADEPGVIKISVGALHNRRKRHLVSLRIPEKVALQANVKLIDLSFIQAQVMPQDTGLSRVVVGPVIITSFHQRRRPGHP